MPSLELARGDVHVWQVDLAAHWPGAHEMLDDAERARVARFVFEEDQRRYRNSHAALRRILGAYLAVGAAEVRLRADVNGKPAIENGEALAFNLSHSGEWALLALSRDASVGVDIEARIEAARIPELAHSVFTAAEVAALEGLEGADLEQAFLRGWTRKEACLKVRGVGLTVEPASLHVGVEPERRRVDTGPIGVPGFVEVESLERPPCGAAAVALDGNIARVVRRELAP